MLPEDDRTFFETTHLRTLGWAGAILFTLGPPTFFYEWWLTFYTTAVEENPTIGPILVLSLLGSCASVPMLLIGRRKRRSPSPTVDAPLAAGAPAGLTRRRA